MRNAYNALIKVDRYSIPDQAWKETSSRRRETAYAMLLANYSWLKRFQYNWAAEWLIGTTFMRVRNNAPCNIQVEGTKEKEKKIKDEALKARLAAAKGIE